MVHPTTLSARDLIRLAEAVDQLTTRLECRIEDAIALVESLATGAEGSTYKPVNVFAKQLRKIRMKRNQRLRTHLFKDPAWEMMLDLSIAHVEDVPITVGELCRDTGIPAKTSRIYVDKLILDGLAEKRDDPVDARRTVVALTTVAAHEMQGILRDVQRSSS